MMASLILLFLVKPTTATELEVIDVLRDAFLLPNYEFAANTSLTLLLSFP
jgi:hypothetical protein